VHSDDLFLRSLPSEGSASARFRHVAKLAARQDSHLETFRFRGGCNHWLLCYRGKSGAATRDLHAERFLTL